MLVSGYAGIGKSSLVHELEKPIVRQRGLFIEGKFDQHKRDVPYSTIVQALRDLVLDMLLEGEERIAYWRERLQAALGTNGQLIVDVIPQLEFLVGRQPPVPELPPAEAQGRFRFVFRRFVGVFARKEHPLTLFVDDVQWADPASLALLQDLVTHPDLRSLLVVGAYRDNEVTPAHPLVAALDSARRAGAHVSGVMLGPLSAEHLTALIADALRCGPREAEPLAALVLEKTGANPFFVVQFLAVLYREGLIAFDPRAGRWSWDVARIRAHGYTDNVIELMVGKLRHLPAEAREALELAACIGGTVDAKTLAIVCQRDPESALRTALEEDLLIRHERTYRFPHDRVQEAAYSLIPEGERAAVHLGIGRLLLARTAPGEVENDIFRIVNQLNRGAALITSREEREQVAQLNLMAGLRAKRSTAYASALSYVTAGAAFLDEECWSQRYELAFALEVRRAECEYLTGALEAAEGRLSTLWHRARNLADLAAITCLCLDLYTTLDQSDRGVHACLEYLRRLGIHWSPHPTTEEVQEEYERIWRQLGSRQIEDLVDLPTMSNSDWRVTMDVLTSLMPAALFTDENLLCLSVGRMANLSLEHGYCDGSSLAYVWLGMILGPYFGNFQAALRFGKLSLELVEKRGLDRFKARVYLCFANFVNTWARHVGTSGELQRRAFDAATTVGDLTFAAYCCNSLITTLLATGEPLGDVQREAEDGLAFARNMGFGLVVDIIASQLRMIRALRGLTPSFSSFDDEEFDEGRFEQHLEQDPRLAIAACWYWIRKLQSRLFAEDYAAAIWAASKADLLLWTSRAFFELAEYHYHGALARAGHHDVALADERPRDLELLVAHGKRLELWAKNCPESFQDRHALVSAELARIEGRELDAGRLYEEAIRSAHENGFVQNEALGYELASKHYRTRGYEQFADLYLREARACYLRWGADGKVRQLERLHPQLVERRPPAPTATFALRNEQLDLLSVVKASQTISGEMEIEKLVGTLLQVALEQGGARRGCLVLQRDGALFVEAEASMEEEGVATRIVPSVAVESSSLVPVSVVQYARLTRQPVIVEDVAAGAGKFASDPYFSRHTTRSVLCVPILRQAELVGLLFLENRFVADAFTPERLTALSLLASQAAISVENALLLGRERVARESAEKAERRAAFLAEAGGLLSASLHYEETMVRLGRLCVRSLADWCVLDIVEDGELRRLAGACADPAREPLLQKLRERYPARWNSLHPAARSLRDGEPLWVPAFTDDLLRSMCQNEEHLEIVRGLGACSAVVVPLVARGQTLGVLSLASGTPGRYARADLELAKEVAQRAAIAIDNARLYRETQRAVRLRDEFLLVASHELRTPMTPLTVSLTALQRWERSGQFAVPAPVSESVALAARQGTRLNRLIGELLDVSRIESGRPELDLSEVDLGTIVREVAARFEPELAGARCRISIRCTGSVVGRWDASRLDQVVTNLVGNALKFGAQRPIEIDCTQEAGVARLAVRDHGIGVDPAHQARIFERFERAVSSWNYGGLGLGLYISRRIVEAHGGTINVESQLGAGSTFIVELPCFPPAGAERRNGASPGGTEHLRRRA
ncbi:MAG: hypothetical protein A2V77_01640 [Anaeromyxobacter sp. RBG_16_69_14]|nr:MAG: hypothetical protein A2V77_01640 [Anaeromyxobacter sp. RBG_16_69_14]